MSTITYCQPDGAEQRVDLEGPSPVMQAALRNGVPGIIGECGGQAMCATCHVYVREDFLDGLPPKSEDEEDMLEEVAAPFDERRSRLGCQIPVGEGISSLVVDVPERQV